MLSITNPTEALLSMVDDEYESKIYRDKWEDVEENYDAAMSRDTEEAASKIDNAIMNNIKQKLQSLPDTEPIHDYKTKNKSFYNLFKTLSKMGIKNNKFFLALYDKSLKGIDPFNASLPLEYQIKIHLECMRNPWYWLREICRIPEDGSPICVGGGSPFIIDRNSLASWYLYLNGLDQYDSKPRQTGKTQNALAIINYTYHYGTMATNITFANKDASNNKNNLYRLKCQRDMLPAYMHMKIALNEAGEIIKGRDSVTAMKNPITGNTISLLPRANSKDSAMTCGRGLTSAVCYFDEFDFMNYNTEILHSAAFAFSRASENAKKNGALYGRIFTSTPGDLDNRDGSAATEWIENMFVWKDKYLDLPIHILKAQATNTESKRNGIVFIEHSWKELGKSQEWYEKQCQAADFVKEVILREILLQRIHGSSLSPFNKDDLFYLQEHKEKPIAEEDFSKNLCPFKFYETFKPKYNYIISVDPAMGMGGDNTAINIDNPYTGKTAAEFSSPYISQPDCADMIVKFMDKYCPNALIVVESNRGTELINCLLRSKYRHRVWYDSEKLGQRPKEAIGEYYNQMIQNSYDRRAYGFNTSTSTRGMLFSLLETLVVEEKEKLNSVGVVSDIFALIRKNGKVQAANGRHDDMILAKLIGSFVYRMANNLEEFGIIRGIMPRDDADDNSPNSILSKIKAMMQRLSPDQQEQLGISGIAYKDEVDDAWEYQKQVQRELDKLSLQTPVVNKDINAISADDIDRANYQFDMNILNSNFSSQSNDEYDIGDFL